MPRASVAFRKPAKGLRKSQCHLCNELQWYCTCCNAIEGCKEVVAQRSHFFFVPEEVKAVTKKDLLVNAGTEAKRSPGF